MEPSGSQIQCGIRKKEGADVSFFVFENGNKNDCKIYFSGWT